MARSQDGLLPLRSAAACTAFQIRWKCWQLGALIYDRYVLFFQIAGLVLLVAMIGAIVLTLRHRDGVKRQDMHAQVNRKREDSVEIVDIKSGEGIG